MKYFKYGKKEIEHLSGVDKKLGAFIKKTGKLKREISGDIFASLIDSIVSQQISGKAAVTVGERLTKLAGGAITPQSIHKLKQSQIQACGMSNKKAEWIKSAANKVVNNEIDLEAVADMQEDAAMELLCTLDGVGVWTAEMLLIFSLGRKNVMSFSDLAIRRGLMNLYGLDKIGKKDFEEYKKRFSPYGTVASFYIWEASAAD